VTPVVVAVVLIALCVWISRWDLRRPGPEGEAARARYPFARPRPSGQRLAVMFVAAIAVCLISLAVLPYLEPFRFP
jgi:hypothetical protein